MRLLAALFGIIDKLLAVWAEYRWKAQGRQEAAKEMEGAIHDDVAKAEAAAVDTDPERIERLRSRFGRPPASE